MDKKKEQDKGLDAQFADDMISMDVVSSTEVTGMAPTPPMTEGQTEGYLNLFPVPQAKAAAAQKADSPQEQEKHSKKQ